MIELLNLFLNILRPQLLLKLILYLTIKGINRFGSIDISENIKIRTIDVKCKHLGCDEPMVIAIKIYYPFVPS